MVRRCLTLFLILLGNLILQSTLFQLIRIRGIIPNTAIVIVVSVSLLRGRTEGALTGLVAGLLQDMFFGTSIGFYGFLGFLTGFFCGRANHNFYRENYLLPLLLCALSTWVYETIVYITGFFFRGDLNYLYFFSSLILPEVVYTAVLSLPIYRILFGINESLEERERHHRKLF